VLVAGVRRHACVQQGGFAGFQAIIDPAHQSQLELQRKRRRQRHQVDVERRPLSVYDALIA
jgi:hypothetical protein